jgi:hypothetical protein
MAFYLLQEDGSKLFLEDLSGFLLLEEEPIAPTVFYQSDGKGRAGRRKRRRNRTAELFESMQATLRRVLDGSLDQPVVPVATVGKARLVYDNTEPIASAIAQFDRLAKPYEGAAQAAQDLRHLLGQYERTRRDLEEDDEELWMMV